jgi:hypothetical protein
MLGTAPHSGGGHASRLVLIDLEAAPAPEVWLSRTYDRDLGGGAAVETNAQREVVFAISMSPPERDRRRMHMGRWSPAGDLLDGASPVTDRVQACDGLPLEEGQPICPLHEIHPALSADGTRLAFVCSRDVYGRADEGATLFEIQNPLSDAPTCTVLLSEPAHIRWPAYHPGRADTLVMEINDRVEREGIFWIRNGSPAGSPTWDPIPASCRAAAWPSSTPIRSTSSRDTTGPASPSSASCCPPTATRWPGTTPCSAEPVAEIATR